MINDETKKEVPELYVDGFNVQLLPFTTLFCFEKSIAGPPGSPRQQEPVIVIRMSPEFAKVVAVMLLRTIRQHEREMKCQINIPQQLLTQFQIAPEDWNVGPV